MRKKCVLSIIESYPIEKNGSKFSHLLTVRAEGAALPPPPSGQPDRKMSLFLMPSLHTLMPEKSFFPTHQSVTSCLETY